MRSTVKLVLEKRCHKCGGVPAKPTIYCESCSEQIGKIEARPPIMEELESLIDKMIVSYQTDKSSSRYRDFIGALEPMILKDCAEIYLEGKNQKALLAYFRNIPVSSNADMFAAVYSKYAKKLIAMWYVIQCTHFSGEDAIKNTSVLSNLREAMPKSVRPTRDCLILLVKEYLNKKEWWEEGIEFK